MTTDPMTSQPVSEATQMEAVAEAGPGATPVYNDPVAEGVDESALSSATGSDAAAVEKQEKPLSDEDTRGKGKTALLMFALCMAVFLAAIDTTIITTALPTIAARFAATQADYSWIGSAYLLAAAASTPLWGKFSDIWGRKSILLFANFVFFIGSLISALSVSIGMLIAGRTVQGIGGGGLLILVNICVSDLFSMRTRGMYLAFIGMTWAIAAACGPILGGVFTEKVSWRWCFYINLPLDGLAFVILVVFLDIHTPRTPLIEGLKAIDWVGSITIAGGTIMLLLGLSFGGVSFAWDSATVICLIVFGIVVITLFFINEWKFPAYPVMPLGLFKERSNLASLAVCFCHGFTFISGSYFLPLYFQAVLGASPLLSGVYLFPFVVPLGISSAGTGIFIRKTGQYLPPIWFGLFFMILGFGLFENLGPHVSWPRIIIFQIIAGLGVGPNFQAPLIALQSHVQPRDIGTATSTFGFIRNISTSIAVVLGSVIFQNQIVKSRGKLLAAGISPAIADQLAGGSAGASAGIVKSLPAAQKLVAQQAYVDALQKMWILFVVVAFVGVIFSFLIRRKELSRTHEVTKTGLEQQKLDRLEREKEKAGGNKEAEP